MKTTEYQERAKELLNGLGARLEVEFLKHGKHFVNDKDTRDIYKITLTRGTRSYSFNFGQSINASGKYQLKEHLRNKLFADQFEKEFNSRYAFNDGKNWNIRRHIQTGEIVKNPNFAAPNEYDIITALTKYDPGTFEGFCSEFGYDTDSRSAETTYNAVKDEFKAMQGLFTDKELEQLNEIQ